MTERNVLLPILFWKYRPAVLAPLSFAHQKRSIKIGLAQLIDCLFFNLLDYNSCSLTFPFDSNEMFCYHRSMTDRVGSNVGKCSLTKIVVILFSTRCKVIIVTLYKWPSNWTLNGAVDNFVGLASAMCVYILSLANVISLALFWWQMNCLDSHFLCLQTQFPHVTVLPSKPFAYLGNTCLHPMQF